ncbi:MAG: hypothetical protein KGJ80_19640, partial [Chloroflexota bacterium]|nr:hypothetical protein [Chloroflexota bacterium]
MPLSIGATGAGIGPRKAVEGFGEQAEGRAFDGRVVLRLLGHLRPHWRRMTAAFALMLIDSALTL